MRTVKTDQTERTPRLIWHFAVHTSYIVCFVIQQLIFLCWMFWAAITSNSLFMIHMENLTIIYSSCYYHLLLLAGGASGVAGLAVDDGVCRVLFRFGELSVCDTVLPVEWRLSDLAVFDDPAVRRKYWFREKGSRHWNDPSNPYQPCHEKICLWGFRPGTTRTGLLGKWSQLETWNFGYRGIIISKQPIIKVLIRLCGCAGWSAPLLFAYR